MINNFLKDKKKFVSISFVFSNITYKDQRDEIEILQNVYRVGEITYKDQRDEIEIRKIYS